MKALSQFKCYNSYIDVLFEDKKESDFEEFLQHMKENKDAENDFKQRIAVEEDNRNILYIINKLWFICKRITKFENYPIKLLSILIEGLINRLERFEGLIELSILILVKGLRVCPENLQNLIYISKKYKTNLNIQALLIHEGFEQYAQEFENVHLNKNEGIFSEIKFDNFKEPTHFKIEM
jgi:hypothetical protein